MVVEGTSRPCLFPVRDGVSVVSDRERKGRTCSQAADDAGACDGCVHDGDDIGEFGLECRVKVGRGVHRGEAVAVCEFGEYADIAAVFKLDAWRAIRGVVG